MTLDLTLVFNVMLGSLLASAVGAGFFIFLRILRQPVRYRRLSYLRSNRLQSSWGAGVMTLSDLIDPPGRTEERILDRVEESSQQLRVLRKEFDRVLSFVPQLAEGPPRPVHDPASLDAEMVVRQLSHSLNSPLLAIDGFCNIMLAAQPGVEEAEWLRQIRLCSNVCKIFLQAFREAAVGGALKSGPGLKEELGLRQSVATAIELYASQGREYVVADTSRLPDFIDGYSTTAVVAVLLPLLENAVEAATPAEPVVTVSYDDRHSPYRLSVENSYPEELPDSIYVAGTSTKNNHDGLGLATARTLVESLLGGRLTHSSSDLNVVFHIEFPERA